MTVLVYSVGKVVPKENNCKERVYTAISTIQNKNMLKEPFCIRSAQSTHTGKIILLLQRKFTKHSSQRGPDTSLPAASDPAKGTL